MKNAKSKKEQTFDERVRHYLIADGASLVKHDLKRNLCINFPRRRRVPLLSRLAMAILRWQGGIVDMRFFNVKQ